MSCTAASHQGAVLVIYWTFLHHWEQWCWSSHSSNNLFPVCSAVDLHCRILISSFVLLALLGVMMAAGQQRGVLSRRGCYFLVFSLFCSFSWWPLLFFVKECSPLCLRPPHHQGKMLSCLRNISILVKLVCDKNQAADVFFCLISSLDGSQGHKQNLLLFMFVPF